MEKEEITELIKAISEDSELLNAFAKLVEKSIDRNYSLKEKIFNVVNKRIVDKLRSMGKI